MYTNRYQEQLKGEYRRLVQESIAKKGASQDEIFLDSTKQEILIDHLKQRSQSQVEELRILSNDGYFNLIFDKLFPYVQEQLTRDEVVNHFFAFKESHLAEDAEERARLEASAARQKRLSDPRTRELVRKEIQDIDQRMANAIQAAIDEDKLKWHRID